MQAGIHVLEQAITLKIIQARDFENTGQKARAAYCRQLIVDLSRAKAVLEKEGEEGISRRGAEGAEGEKKKTDLKSDISEKGEGDGEASRCGADAAPACA